MHIDEVCVSLPMSDLFMSLLALVAVNAIAGSVLALSAGLRGRIGARELRVWVASSLGGLLVGALLVALPASTPEAYFLSLLWMLLLVAASAAGLVLSAGRDPERRLLGTTVYRTAVVASSSWIATMVGLVSWLAP